MNDETFFILVFLAMLALDLFFIKIGHFYDD